MSKIPTKDLVDHCPVDGMSLNLSEGSVISDVTDFTANVTGTDLRNSFSGTQRKSRMFRQSPLTSSLRSSRGIEDGLDTSSVTCSSPSRAARRVSFSDNVDMKGGGTAKKRSFLKRRLLRRASADVSSNYEPSSSIIDEREPLNNDCQPKMSSMPDISDEGSSELVDRYSRRSGRHTAILKAPTKGPKEAIPPRAPETKASNANGVKTDLMVLGETTKALYSALRIGAYLGTRFQIDRVKFTPRGCVWNVLCSVNPGGSCTESHKFQFPAKVTCCENRNNSQLGQKFTVEIGLDDIYEELWEENPKEIKRAAEWLRCRIVLYISQMLDRQLAPDVIVVLPQALVETEVDPLAQKEVEKSLPFSRLPAFYPTPISSMPKKSQHFGTKEQKVSNQDDSPKENNVLNIQHDEGFEAMYPTPKSKLPKRNSINSSASLCSRNSADSNNGNSTAGTVTDETLNAKSKNGPTPFDLDLLCGSLADLSTDKSTPESNFTYNPCKTFSPETTGTTPKIAKPVVW